MIVFAIIMWWFAIGFLWKVYRISTGKEKSDF